MIENIKDGDQFYDENGTIWTVGLSDRYEEPIWFIYDYQEVPAELLSSDKEYTIECLNDRGLMTKKEYEDMKEREKTVVDIQQFGEVYYAKYDGGEDRMYMWFISGSLFRIHGYGTEDLTLERIESKDEENELRAALGWAHDEDKARSDFCLTKHP